MFPPDPDTTMPSPMEHDTPTDALQKARALIANDSYAITFQTFGQYRSALLKVIDVWLAALAVPQAEPVHPNHRPDLRYVLMVLEKVRDLVLPTFPARDAAHGEIAAAITGMRYIIDRTEAAAAPAPLAAAPVSPAVQALPLGFMSPDGVDMLLASKHACAEVSSTMFNPEDVRVYLAPPLSPAPDEPLSDPTLIADLEHRARWWRQPGIGNFPAKDAALDFAGEIERAIAAIRTRPSVAPDERSEADDVAVHRVPLTEGQVLDLSRQWGVYRPNAFAPTLQTWTAGAGGVIELARAVERAHGIGVALPRADQQENTR
jgi:hypothetical protein